MALGLTQLPVKMSTRNIPGGKGGRCVRLTTSPPSCAECHEIWEPKPPGTPWATPDLLRDCFTFTFLLYYGTTSTAKSVNIWAQVHFLKHAHTLYKEFKTGTNLLIPLPRYLDRSAFMSDDFPTFGTPITITEKSFSSLRLYLSEAETNLTTVGMIWNVSKTYRVQ